MTQIKNCGINVARIGERELSLRNGKIGFIRSDLVNGGSRNFPLVILAPANIKGIERR